MTPLLVDKRCRLTITEALCLTVAKLGNFRRKKCTAKNCSSPKRAATNKNNILYCERISRQKNRTDPFQRRKTTVSEILNPHGAWLFLTNLCLGDVNDWSTRPVLWGHSKKYSPSAGSVLGKYMYLRIKQPCFLEHRPLMYIFHVLELPIAC